MNLTVIYKAVHDGNGKITVDNARAALRIPVKPDPVKYSNKYWTITYCFKQKNIVECNCKGGVSQYAAARFLTAVFFFSRRQAAHHISTKKERYKWVF